MRKFLAGVALLAFITPALAAESPLDARFSLDVGWFFLSTDTQVRVDGENTQLPGSDIDFDSTFGVDDEDRLRLDAMWRFSSTSKHAIHALWFENNRRGTRTMTRDVNFGDETFPIDATVKAETNFTVAELYYDYAFVRKDSFEFAAGGGLHMLDMGLSLDGTISGGGGSASGSVSQSASTSAPLPVIGARGLWRLSDKFYASVQGQFFYVESGGYTGSLSDLKGLLVWQVKPHFGVGIGYDSFRFHFKVEDEGNFNGRLRFGYGGAMIFANVSY